MIIICLSVHILSRTYFGGVGAVRPTRNRIEALGGSVAHNTTPILAAKLNERNIILTADLDRFAEAVRQATNLPT
jgi:hypothetical protein